uniref:Uncharacterized protein n=1 Tax=Arundo donax TaxID=35708 RepID=A0A0A8YQS7_ARUDO
MANSNGTVAMHLNLPPSQRIDTTPCSSPV